MRLKFEIEPHPELNLKDLIKLTEEPFFKIPISERYKQVSNPTYLGWDYKFYQDEDGRVKVWIEVYFKIKGAKHVKKKKGISYRNTYIVALEFPYIKNIRTFQKMYQMPVRVFSSDPSFMFYFAYAFHTRDGVITDRPEFKKWINYAITHYPKIRNPMLITQLAKHLYKLVRFLAKEKTRNYLDKNKRIKVKKINIPEWKEKPKHLKH